MATTMKTIEVANSQKAKQRTSTIDEWRKHRQHSQTSEKIIKIKNTT